MTPEEQLQQIRELKVEARACMSAASRMLDASANDLRLSHIEDAVRWLDSALDMLRQMSATVEKRIADEHDQEMERRRAALTQRDPYAVMAAAKLDLPVTEEAQGPA